MSGRILGILILATATFVGAAIYYLQIYAYYRPVPPEDAMIRATPKGGGDPVALPLSAFQGIDADTSPIRFRACFTVAEETIDAAEFVRADDPVPLNAPGWFDCFDAAAIADDIDAGRATAVLGEANVIYGIDRILALYPDGRGVAWHQINICGEEVFDGRPAPAGCPPRPGG